MTFLWFFDAPTHLYKRLCPSVCRSVGHAFVKTETGTHWGKRKSLAHSHRSRRSAPLRTTRSAPFRSASLRSTPLRSRRSAPLRAASRRSLASEKATYHNMQMRSGRIVGLRWPCFFPPLFFSFFLFFCFSFSLPYYLDF